MKIKVTEGKSAGYPFQGTVRVFLDEDYSYGVWVEEQKLLSYLSPTDIEHYVSTEESIDLDVDINVARAILEAGYSPFKKQTLN